jgi:hypothetical protein
MTRQQLHAHKLNKYPHLDPQDPRLDLYDHEILSKEVTLDDCVLEGPKKDRLQHLLLKYKEAFSLHSEVGNTDLTVDFDLLDKSPFYIRPFPVPPDQRPMVQKELEKLVKMGVLQEASTQYTSPIMLIRKKDSQSLRLVADFRYLNNRIVRRNMPFPLLRDTIQTIGHAQPAVISVIDLKEAYHSLTLTEKAASYCGISSFHGGTHYRYCKLPMGLGVSPAAFQSHINKILQKFNATKYCIAIMDDLLVFSPTIDKHFDHVETIFNAIQTTGLKISPSKAKLFRSTVTYMGHKIMIRNGKPFITPLRERTEAITKLPIPNTKRRLKGFIGKVSYLAQYLPRLQTLLRPLHTISSKKAQFVWNDVTQKAYDDIIALLIKPPILSMPTKRGLFRLYCGTSKIGVGASLWQIQNGKEQLLGYFSKSLPPQCSRYSATELELNGVLIACNAFKHLLKSTSFELFTDHSAITYIMKSKHEPPTERIKRLLEKLSAYSMKVGYRKGSTMVIADYLSRNPQTSNDSNCDIAFPVTRSGKDTDTVTQKPSRKKSTTKVNTYPQTPQTPRVPPSPMIPKTPETPKRAGSTPTGRRSSLTDLIRAASPAVQPPNSLVELARRRPRYTPNYEHPVVSSPHPADQGTNDRETEDGGNTPPHLLKPHHKLEIDTTKVRTSHIPKQSILSQQLQRLQDLILPNLGLPFNRADLIKHQASCFHFQHIYAYVKHGSLPANKTEA